MRIHVFKKHQDPASESPAHTISRALALKICAAIAVKILSESAIQLNTDESFTSIKDRFRKREDAITVLPVRLWEQCLLLYYPHKSQESQFRA